MYLSNPKDALAEILVVPHKPGRLGNGIFRQVLFLIEYSRFIANDDIQT
jgi:hypothetical protein